MTAREGAYDILRRVQEEGAYANLALDQFLDGKGRGLDRRDKGFLTELVYGTIKFQLKLDWVIDAMLIKGGRLRTGPRILLRMAFYQILYMDRVPARAVVNESVNLAKKRFHAGVASLVNGILRGYIRRPEGVVWPGKGDMAQYISVMYSHPRWMVERWIRRYGPEATQTLCDFNNKPAELWIRANTLCCEPEALCRRLESEGCRAEPGFLPESVRIQSGPSVADLRSYQEGWFAVQDLTSMLAARALAPNPGDRVLDVCAAPGGKTGHLAQLMRDQGVLMAMDIHPHRVALIQQNMDRLGITCVTPLTGDGTQLPPWMRGAFDRILLDAPCSGLGVLRRRPDARWRRNEQDVRALAVLQQTLLHGALDCLKPGGRLIYSTCTLEPEENIHVVERVFGARQDVAFFKRPLQYEPFKDGMEGFFLAGLYNVEGRGDLS
jgi:16S rRNA (cytosine967-C5)-methyltransferase